VKTSKICCGRIDPTQAVKATGFNTEDTESTEFLNRSSVSSVVVFPADVVYVNRVVMHPTDHYKNIKNSVSIYRALPAVIA